MSAYLYTWNPKRWKWADQPEAICRIGDGEQYDIYWSCGNTKKIVVGDIFFLIKLGVEPKGIIGCGYISSVPYPLPHWDEEKARQGKDCPRYELICCSRCYPRSPLSSSNSYRRGIPRTTGRHKPVVYRFQNPSPANSFQRFSKARHLVFRSQRQTMSGYTRKARARRSRQKPMTEALMRAKHVLSTTAIHVAFAVSILKKSTGRLARTT